MLESFWLSPAGEIVGTGGKHIDTIIKYPAKFGLSMERIQSKYDKYEEPLGVEGKAREELIGMVLKGGWVRVREYRNRWSMTVDWLAPKVRLNISKFADYLYNGKLHQLRLRDKFSEVTIVELGTSKRPKTYTFDELANYYLVENKDEIKQIKESFDVELVVIGTVADLPDPPHIPMTFEERLEIEQFNA
jgi:hypothetical protein